MSDLALRAQKPIDDHQQARQNSPRALLAAASVGAAVALSLGVYGRSHTPTGLTIDPIQPSDLLSFKSALATVGVTLAIFQMASAAWLFGAGPFRALARPSWLGPAHRWSGTVAFLFTLPAAYHCLWALGFQTTTPRVVIHSLLGCAFYGAFATKLLVVRSNRMPGWALPIVGATVVTLLVAIWFSSALWFYTGQL